MIRFALGSGLFHAFVLIGRIVLVLAVLASALVESLLLPTGIVRASILSCSPEWVSVPSPRHENTGNEWLDLALISSDDAWVVGMSWGLIGPRTMMAHWDGHKWKMLSSPHWVRDELYAVEAISSNDVWAAGYLTTAGGNGYSKPLFLHWNGTGWTRIKAPKVRKSRDSGLYGLDAISASNVWAVGSYSDSSHSHALAMNWNGTKWAISPTPFSDEYSNLLRSVAAVSATDVWAVGFSDSGVQKTLAMHFDGVGWSEVSTPNPSQEINRLLSVTAIASDDVWAVGEHWDDAADKMMNLTIHWDGLAWSVVPSPTPNPIGAYNPLTGVVGLSSDNVWTVGTTMSQSLISPLVLNWNGDSWSQVPSPRTGSHGNWLTAIDALSATDLWLAGYYYLNATDHFPLLQHYGPPIPRGKTISPAKKTVVSKRRVSLDWQDLACSSEYEVIVKQSNPEGVSVFHKTGLAQSQATTTKLAKGTKYVWSVRGCNDDGCGFWSNWRSFQIVP